MLSYKLNKFKRNLFLKSFSILYKNGYSIAPPRYILWDCTRKCNLNCIHCGASKERYEQELSESQVKKLIDELAQIGVKTFAVTGGEPLTRKDLLTILEYASSKGMKTGIATNGFLITKDLALKIKDSGINSIQVSIDGNEQIHNQIRGNPNSYERASSAIRNLSEAGIEDVSVASTITPRNFDILQELMDIVTSLKVKSWRICVIMPIGRATKNNLSLSKNQIHQLFKFIIKNKKKIPIELGENLPFLAQYDPKIRKAPIICPVGIIACCIGVDGHVRGCPEQPDIEKFREGSILEKPFLDIWQKGFRKYRSREILKSDTKCAKCKSKNDCFGGCWVMREGNTHCIYDLI